MTGKHGAEATTAPERNTVVDSGQQLYTFVEFGPLSVISLRHSGTFRTLERTWRSLIHYTDARGLTNNAQLLGVVYDDPAHVPVEHLRYDACIAAPEHRLHALGLPEAGELPLRFETLGAVRAWRTTHHGRFDALSATYRRALDTTAFQQQGVVAPCPRPPFYEIYRSGIGSGPEDEASIEIYLPVPPRNPDTPSRPAV
jgi:DNA gyrase inhibitor GyrI